MQTVDGSVQENEPFGELKLLLSLKSPGPHNAVQKTYLEIQGKFLTEVALLPTIVGKFAEEKNCAYRVN